MEAPGVPVHLRSWMCAVGEIARAANAGEPVPMLLGRVAARECALIGFDYCAVLLAGGEPGRLQMAGGSGHILGGTAQGIGTALYEELVYDDEGQLITSSFLDYTLPTAAEMPEMSIGHIETPSPYTPHGIKGGGEGGRMMAPAAINAAVNDALAPLGVRVTELPMTPDRLRAAIRAAGGAPSPTR